MTLLPICDRLLLAPDCDVSAMRDNSVEAAGTINALHGALSRLLLAIDCNAGVEYAAAIASARIVLNSVEGGE